MKTISLLSLLFLFLVTAKAQTADLILHNGIVWTVFEDPEANVFCLFDSSSM